MLNLKSILWVTALCLLVPVAAAQDDGELDRGVLEQQMKEAEMQLEEASRKIAELSRALSRDEVMTLFGGMGKRKPRAMLGVTIGAPQNGAGGVLITGVSPGGPASDAGLQSDDVIVGINRITVDKQNGDDAMRALLDELENLAPGDIASVQIRRGDQQLAVDVTTADLSSAMAKFKMQFGEHNFEFDSDTMELLQGFGADAEGVGGPNVVIELHGMEALADLPEKLEAGLGDLDGMAGIAMLGGPLFGPRLDLVPVSGDLGSYFGVERGLLLTTAPPQDLGLKAGDVILAVDGERVETAGDVRHRFLSTDAGKVLAFEIVRQRESLNLDVTVPAAAPMGDWNCSAAAEGHGRKCVKKNGNAYQFRYSDKD